MVSESWQRNIRVMFVAEFIVIMGFSFITPFMPLFVMKLGSFTDKEAALWAGIATGANGIAMFLSAPIWGIIADRWGRKPMVLRAMFGSAIVLALAGMAPNVYWFVALRFAQGLLSGTVAAASALVAASTPVDKRAYAMGLLMVAVFIGDTFGPLIGGFMADSIGFKNAFFSTSAILCLGGLLVLFLVKERFERPAEGQRITLRTLLRLASSREILPLLIVIGILRLGLQMVWPIIPLLSKELGVEGAATTAGAAFALMGVLAAASSIIAGRLGLRINLKKILFFCCIGTGLLYLPPMWAVTVAQLIILVGLTGLFKGGILTSSNALISLAVPINQQGIAFGVAQSAMSLGNGLGPIVGGSLVSLVGLRPVFGITSGVFIILGIFITRLMTR